MIDKNSLSILSQIDKNLNRKDNNDLVNKVSPKEILTNIDVATVAEKKEISNINLNIILGERERERMKNIKKKLLKKVSNHLYLS